MAYKCVIEGPVDFRNPMKCVRQDSCDGSWTTSLVQISRTASVIDINDNVFTCDMERLEGDRRR